MACGVECRQAVGHVDTADLPSSLIGYWSLNGNTFDASGNDLHSVAVNGEYAQGLWGDAFFFDGDDVLVVVDSGAGTSPLDPQLVLMMAWVFPSARGLTGGSGANIIMNKESVYEYGLDGHGMMQGALSPCWRWWGTAVVALDEWTHTAVGLDGINEVHYINGALAEQTACAGDLTDNAEDFKIGARGGDGAHGSPFHGAVDEAMLFGGVLTAEEVMAIYTATYQSQESLFTVDMSLLPAGLVGYWPLDGDGTEQLGESGLDAVVTSGEWVPGLHRMAFEFDGDDALIVVDPDGQSLLNSELMMMLAWIFPAEELQGGAGANIIMNKENVYEYGLDAAGTLQGAFSPCWRWWGTAVLAVAEWTHAAAGIDGNSEVHYVNGERVESTACAGVLTPNDADFQIGARGGDATSGAFFHGSLDDVMLFSGALTDNDMLSLFLGVGGDAARPTNDYRCPSGLWCASGSCFSEADCEETSTISCTDVTAAFAIIDIACPSTTGEVVPGTCPESCQAAFLPWWHACQNSNTADGLDAQLGGQLSVFYRMCSRSPPAPPAPTPLDSCTENGQCLAMNQNIRWFCAAEFQGSSVCKSCAVDCHRSSLDIAGAECKMFCRASDTDGGH